MAAATLCMTLACALVLVDRGIFVGFEEGEESPETVSPIIQRIREMRRERANMAGAMAPVASERLTEVFDGRFDTQYAIYRVPAIAHIDGMTLAFAEAHHSSSLRRGNDIVVKVSLDRDNWSDIRIVVGASTGLPGFHVDACSTTTFTSPVPVALPEEGAFLLVFTVNETDVFSMRSSDGRVWDPPVNISQAVKMPGWGLVGTGPGHGIQLLSGPHKGRVVVPFNHMLAYAQVTQVTRWVPSDPGDVRSDPIAETTYRIDNHYGDHAHGATHRLALRDRVEGNVFDALHPGGSGFTVAGLDAFEARAQHAAALYSDDGGLTWGVGADVPYLASSQLSIAQLENGEVVASFRVSHKRGHGCRHFAFSSDGAMSWQPLVPAGATQPEHFNCTVLDPGCHGSLLAHGSVLYASGPHSRISWEDLTLYASQDGGNHWKAVGKPPSPEQHAGFSDLVSFPPHGTHAWPEVGVVFEHDKDRSRILLWRASLGEQWRGIIRRR